MANKTNYNYSNFDVPYNDYLERTDTIPSSSISSTYGDDIIQNPGNLGENVLDGKAIDNLVIKSWIKSNNYRPKNHGFIIDGRLGYIECMQLYVGNGGIVGGALDIPDYTTANSFHVDSTGNMWMGINTSGPITSAPAYILNDGTAKFTNIIVTIQPGSTGVANLSDAGDLALQDNITDAQAPYSLRGWTNDIVFTAIDYRTVAWTAGTIKFSNGTTFSINSGSTGNMSNVTYIYFDGSSSNLQVTTNYASAIGSGYVLVCVAKPSSGGLSNAFYQVFGGSGGIAVQPIVTADNIVSNYVYTNELAANQITAGSGIINNLTVKSTLTMGDSSTTGIIQSYGYNGIVDGFQIKGGTSPGISLIGGNIRTAATGQHMTLNNSNLTGYSLTNETTTNKRMQLDYDSLEFYSSTNGDRTISYDPDGITFWQPGTTNKRGRFWTDGSYYYIDAGYNSLYGLLFRTAEVSGNNPICSMNYVGGVGLLKMQGTSQRIESNRITVDTHINFGYSSSGDSGYGFRDNGGIMEYKNSAGSWTAFSSGSFTGIYAGTGLTGSAFPVPDGGTISHITGSGYNHIPSGGSTNQMLRYQSPGKAQWSTDAYAEYFRDNSSTTKYLHYTGSTWEVNDDFYSSGYIEANSGLKINGSSAITFGSSTFTFTGTVKATKLEMTNYSSGIKLGSYNYKPENLTVVTSVNFGSSTYTTVNRDFLTH